MNKRFPLWCVVLLAAGSCKPAVQKEIRPSEVPASVAIENDGIACSVSAVQVCGYPAGDPLFEKKTNKKLLLLRMKVNCLSTGGKNSPVPQGATLIDTKGNEYETAPAVIAMAQNNHCISGDDIKAYNAIWNGKLKAGDTQTAYVLGFEIPADAQPDKLYWNKGWKDQQLFFSFTNTNVSVNH